MPTLHLIIKGKVQGVFYRAAAKETAERLHVKGWIKNTASGDVEALVTGSEDHLQLFITWCKQGPRRASVSEVIFKEHEEVAFKDFSVLR